MKRKFDHVAIGLACGIFAPIITFYVYYLLNYKGIGIGRFVDYLTMGNIFGPTLSLCVIANLAVFFLYIYTERMQSARGVLLSTFLYAGVVAYFKYLN
jgi:hypothetical protein